MSSDPWFSSWNYDLLRILFTWIPHRSVTDNVAEAFISTPILSTWIFAFCFYRFWTKNDEQRQWRRRYLAISVEALAIAGLMTIVLRPWVQWAAPVLSTNFQPLFPRYLWGEGVTNCFPSHSTLAYFTVAAGFWPLSRRLSVLLGAFALLFISFPRVYEGGHYPVDVLFSCVVGSLVLVLLWRWPFLVGIGKQLPMPETFSSTLREFAFFLWVFELGEGFRGLEFVVHTTRRVFFRG